jgi:hypothetical protein
VKIAFDLDDRLLPGRLRRLMECARVTCIVALALAARAFAAAPDARTFGDPALRPAIDARVKEIYELTAGPDIQVELLTRDNPLQLKGAVGTELTAAMVSGSPARIVGAVWTRRGKYSVEFYRADDKLLMVYETFSLFGDSAPADAWHNFMGLPGWERRIYFDPQGDVGYAEARGQAPPPETAGKQLQQEAKRVVELLDRSPARWERK